MEGVEDNDRNVNPKLSCAEAVEWNPAAKALCQRDFGVSLAELVGSKVKLINNNLNVCMCKTFRSTVE